jgi:cyclopropane fatty-acyl-phospholipid synthase-like methyltransferase
MASSRRITAKHQDDENRARYVASLASVLRPGGRCYLICFSDRQPGDSGPRRVRQDELRAAFSDGWAITSIEAATFEVNEPRFGIPFAQAWLAVIERVGQDYPGLRQLPSDR